jgi:hypothetical protein
MTSLMPRNFIIIKSAGSPPSELIVQNGAFYYDIISAGVYIYLGKWILLTFSIRAAPMLILTDNYKYLGRDNRGHPAFSLRMKNIGGADISVFNDVQSKTPNIVYDVPSIIQGDTSQSDTPFNNKFLYMLTSFSRRGIVNKDELTSYTINLNRGEEKDFIFYLPHLHYSDIKEMLFLEKDGLIPAVLIWLNGNQTNSIVGFFAGPLIA